MRRLVLVAGALLAVVIVVVAIGSRSGSSDDYRVAAIFDTTKGMVAGQQVKIAGAVVGNVEEIELAPGPKARMLMSIEEQFGPFRRDATCSIRPEGLISENYVECEPGTAAAELDGDGVPTVALAHTTVPVSLQDVLNVFSLPTDQRLRVLITQLGIATSGRGQDLDALLRRANPALKQSRRALAIFAEQRDQIADAIGQTDQVLDRIDRQGGQVRAFVGRAADVARTTAQRRTALGQSIERLPAMLDAVRPGLRSLDRAATDASPLLDSLRESGAGLVRLTRTLPDFARAGVPALKSLASVTSRTRPVLRRALPTASQLQHAAAQLGPLAPEIDRLLVSLRDSGGIEGTMRLLYTLAVLASAYDGTSHLINFVANVAPNCMAAQVLNRDEPGCSTKWSSPGEGTIPINSPSCGPQKPEHVWRNHRCPLAPPVGTFPPRKRERESSKQPKPKPAAPTPSATSTPAPPTKPPTRAPLELPSLDLDLPGVLDEQVTELLDFLLKP